MTFLIKEAYMKKTLLTQLIYLVISSIATYCFYHYCNYMAGIEVTSLQGWLFFVVLFAVFNFSNWIVDHLFDDKNKNTENEERKLL